MVTPEPVIEPVIKPAAAASSAAAADAAAAICSHSPVPSTGKARRVRSSGIVTWTDSDREEAERLERETPQDLLVAAVQQVVADGKEPVPGRVSMALDSLARRRRAEKAAAARRQAVEKRARAELDPEAVDVGRRLLAARGLRVP